MSVFDERLVLPEHVDADVLLGAQPVLLKGETAHHLTRALRLRDGAIVRVGDGHGATRVAELRSTGRQKVVLSWVGAVERSPKPLPSVTLTLCGLQGKDLDAAVVSCVEAGADQIWLFASERSQRASLEPGSSTWSRLQRLNRSAATQSKRPWLPELAVVHSLEEALDKLDWSCFADASGAVELCWGGAEEEDRKVGVFVGPEGGWTDAERETFERRGVPGLWLGPNVLRARTAAPVAVHRMTLIRAKARLEQG